MKKLNYLLLMGLILTSLFSSCRKDIINNDTSTTFPTPKITVVTDLAIMVMDEQDNPLQNADITIKNSQYSTDENGIVQLKGVNLDKAGAMINVSTPDRYDVQKVIIPKKGNQNFLKVKMMKKDISGNIQSNEGGVVQADLGGHVLFSPNSIIKADGSDYSGVVQVYARHLNPTSENLNETMPGNLSAINSDNSEVQLATYGMMVVELESPSGDKLQIADGKEATIEMPIPSGLISDAPQTIPLWHYDTDKGKWVEEGSAELQGDKYVGQVSHFSYWNCDVPFDLVNFHARFVDESNLPYAFHTVKIFNNGNATVGYDVTDNQGNTEGKVPKNENLTIQLLNECNEVSYESDIPASTDDIDLGTIIVASSQSNLVQLTGQVVDCDSNPVVNSYVLVRIDNSTNSIFIPTDENAEFDITVNFCSNNSGEIFAVDVENLKNSDVVDFTIDPQNPSYSFGQITTCNALEEYIIFESDYPFNRTYVLCNYNQRGTSVEITAGFNQNDSLSGIYIITSFPEDFIGEVTEEYNMWIESDSIYINDNNMGTMTITANGGPGNFIEGNIQSDMILHTNNTTTVTIPGSVEFRVKID